MPEQAGSKTDGATGFVCPQTRPGAATRLFLFPFAGGGPAAFARWSAGFPNSLEVWVAHYPGRSSRLHDEPMRRLLPLVENLSQSIRPLIDKPFAFFGHSLGGLVLFELARYLRRENLPEPAAVFISACRAPHVPDPDAPIHDLSDAEFLTALDRLNGIPKEILQNPETLELFLPAMRADFECIENYQFDDNHPPLDCPIFVFGGLDDPRVSRDQLEGWSNHTTSRFGSRYYPGDHFFVNRARDPIIQAIVLELESATAGG
jgi:medium-chain acyl-[acyl-carrier-protein] hydrolase